MKTLKMSLATISLVLGEALIGCSSNREAPDVTRSIRQGLDQAGLKDVSVKQDNTNRTVTLTGHVPNDGDKAQAEAIAKQFANGQVVADEVAVLPPGQMSQAKAVDSDVDQGIEKNLDAALIQNGLHKDVKYNVKNGVVTLTGDVHSQATRGEAARVAATVPNVNEVVNEVQVKHQRATSTP